MSRNKIKQDAHFTIRFKSYPRVSQILLSCTSPGVRPHMSKNRRLLHLVSVHIFIRPIRDAPSSMKIERTLKAIVLFVNICNVLCMIRRSKMDKRYELNIALHRNRGRNHNM
jgi:hypothetical protein